MAKHTEIRDWIEGEIRSGRLAVGDRLPTEAELREMFGVSRNPVQKAMTGLVEAGIVTRRRGAGTRVASTGLRGNILRTLDTQLTEPEVAGAHRVDGVRVATAASFPLAAGVLDPGAPLAELVRTKLDTSGAPIALERCVVDLTQVPDLLDQDLVHLTTTAHYMARGIADRHVSSTLTAVHLDAADAALLGVGEDTPILRQVRTIQIAERTPLEIAEFLFHPTNITMEVSQLEPG
ncbi:MULTISPECIES: GntR family transcriptional regulator [Brevibacterium]|uniref:GntR family transcriptional regulator n=1 Tax=Brevibacterium salitolerans TaxID=1403566 RepID=A0ABP5IV45_9MICO|nr:GntR family transcriptional regulator [Brevibacterium sp.]